jgi:DNA repair protein RadD
MTELRPYQKEAVEKILHSKSNRQLVVSPTGSGKTIVATTLMKEHADRFKNSLFVVHRREIVLQTRDKLEQQGISAGIIMAGERPDLLAGVQVAAIQTLHARAIRCERMKMPVAHLVIIDEAHHACATTYKKVIEAYPDAKIVGLTATPCRGDGRGLGGIFDELIELPQVPDLIEKGFLVPTVNFGPHIDLRGIATRQGDYAVEQLADRMNTDRLVGNIVVHWLKYSERRKTVVFAVDVAHSVHIAEELVKAGVRAEHIDGTTPKAQRDETLARLARGEIEVVSNCMVLTEGWDMPDVGCCVLARPTRKMGLYRQMVGRVLRPAPGKTNAIVIDHSGAVYRHGFVEDRVEWPLSPEGKPKNEAQRTREDGPTGSRIIECSQCGCMREGGKPCPNCGFLPPKKAIDHEVIDSELCLIDRRGSHKPVYSAEDRHRWHAMLRRIGEERGYKPGWAAHKHKEKFGDWPPYGAVEPIEPTPEVRSWVRSRMIAYAKARAA